MIPKLLQDKLRLLYGDFREANQLVCNEIGKEYTEEDVRKMDKSFTDFYNSVEDIRTKLGVILDMLDKGSFDE